MAARKAPKKALPGNAIKTPVQLYRVSTNMARYRQAVTAAENFQHPNRVPLYELYQQTMLDAQVNACWNQAKNLILGSKFCVYDKQKNENEEKTRIIRRKWFREFIDLSLDAVMWGHSLPQFDDIITKDGIDEFKSVELVPREYVKPEFDRVMPDTSSMPPAGIDYTEYPTSLWCVPVGKKRDLGLLLKLTPLVIWKKNAMGAWAEFIEKFGAPIRIGKTDSTDLESVQQMEDMLKNMGVAAWGLFKTDDEIELLQAGHTDAYEVYDKMIERCNSEIAKLILGQTGTTDEKSFVGSAEVHERVLSQVGESLHQFIYSVINDQLVPVLNELGFGLDGYIIDIEQEDEFNLEQKSKFDIELLKTGKFTFTPEYLQQKYGTEVKEVKESKVDQKSLQEYKNVLSQYYS